MTAGARRSPDLDRLAELEAAAPEAAAGETLLHLDLRVDNLLLAPDRVVVVDGPHARVGAAWMDLLFFAPSVAMQGGPPPRSRSAATPTPGMPKGTPSRPSSAP